MEVIWAWVAATCVASLAMLGLTLVLAIWALDRAHKWWRK